MPPRAMVQRTMAERHGLTRGLGLLEATALNMSNMVGVGPFVTIPLLIGAMGGPQCLLGWAVGYTMMLARSVQRRMVIVGGFITGASLAERQGGATRGGGSQAAVDRKS